MPIRFLVDENLRGTLSIVLVRVATRYGLSIDVVQIGDDTALPLGTEDPEILIWSELQGRILISRDRRTLATHLASHLRAGHHSPGILLLRDVPLIDAADFLVILAFASAPEEWCDRIGYIPE